jgi:hypothetical protein
MGKIRNPFEESGTYACNGATMIHGISSVFHGGD